MKNRTMRPEAMKIMEAFAGVDEELLARCEDAAGSFEAQAGEEKTGWKHKWNKKKNLYLWRLSSCAALLCLFAIGVLSWRGMEERSSDSMMYGNKEGKVFNNAAVLECETDGTGSGVFPEKENAVPLLPPAESESSGGADGATADITAAANGDLSGQVPKQETVNEWLEERKENEQVDKTDAVIDDDTVEYSFVDPRERELTEAEAGQVELLGGYIPTKLPAGYVFGAACFDSESLTLSWHKGMDGIMISIKAVDGEPPETVDVTKRECYDERLYEIPYGVTVPKEYFGTFNSPVFAKDDFSLEIVSSRMLSYSGDTGDTSTPRGRFSVLYDGVVVYFNGRGTPEQIWEMFSSIQE